MIIIIGAVLVIVPSLVACLIYLKSKKNRALKMIIGIALTIFLLLFAGYIVIIMDVRKRSIISTYNTFFSGIVIRAIQLERVGSMGVAKNNQFNTRSVYPPDMEAAREYVRDLYQSGREFGCDAEIRMPPVDPREFDPTVATLLDYRPFRYVVVFHGAPPDISMFLDPNTNAQLLEQLPYYEDPSEIENWAYMKSDFDQISRRFSDRLRWRAVECRDFSYIEFWERSFWGSWEQSSFRRATPLHTGIYGQTTRPSVSASAAPTPGSASSNGGRRVSHRLSPV